LTHRVSGVKLAECKQHLGWCLMGQKTDFNPDEWDLSDDLALEDFDSKDENSQDKQDFDALEAAYEPAQIFDDPGEVIKELMADKGNTEDKQPRKIVISRKNSGQAITAQEEDAFRKQIEDLFELLELEKEDVRKGVRVYQTDPSPSMPWRFH